MDKQCSGITKSGERCRGWVIPGSRYCLSHDPARVVELAEYRRQGGHGKSNQSRARKAIAGDLRDLGAVQATLRRVLQKLEDGRIEPGIATAVASVSNALVKVAQAGAAANFEQQLADMARQIAELSEKRGA